MLRQLPTFICILFCMGVLAAETGRADTCQIDLNAQSGSFESLYTPKWTYNQAMITNLWSSFNFGKGDWHHGWGADNPWDNNYLLTRAMNGAYLLYDFQHAHVWHTNTDPKVLTAFDYVKEESTEGYTPTCDMTFVAKTGTSGYIPAVKLSVLFGFDMPNPNLPGQKLRGETVAERAAIYVHEIVHAHGKSHDGEGKCADPTSKGSCDWWFGDYNANTMATLYLYDLYAAYRLDVNNHPNYIASGPIGKRVCKLDTYLTELERKTALLKVKYNATLEFVAFRPGYSDSWGANLDYTDTTNCEVCSPNSYVWNDNPNLRGNLACPEYFIEAAQTNSSNRNVCTKLSDPKINPDLLSVQKNRASLQMLLQPCPAPNQNELVNYCSKSIPSAATTNDLDPLDLFPANTADLLNCQEDFCASLPAASRSSSRVPKRAPH